MSEWFVARIDGGGAEPSHGPYPDKDAVIEAIAKFTAISPTVKFFIGEIEGVYGREIGPVIRVPTPPTSEKD